MIEVKRLSKYFGTKKVVDDVSFGVEKGEILGFLGPNGAGKSTTMRMITGFIPASGGTAIIGGFDIAEDSVSARKKIGYLPENAPAYPDMTVTGYLDFCAEVRGFTGSARKRRVAETIEKCFLADVKFQTVSTLSKGFKQRVCFAQSIIHDPEYLILDEPTDGLDPNQKHVVRRMIREMSAEKAMIISTHILDEVDAVCSRAIIIANGRIVANETPAGLRAQAVDHGALSLTLEPTDPQKLIACLEQIQGIKSAKIIDTTATQLKIRVYPDHKTDPLTQRVLSTLLEKKYAIDAVSVEQGRLDEVFRTITGG